MGENIAMSHGKFLVVRDMPLFAGLSVKDKKLIARSAVLTEYKKDDNIYRQGGKPDALYCVVTGRVKVCITYGRQTEDLEYFKRGKYFGVISLLTGEPHSVSAKAVNDSIILKVPREDFLPVMNRIPQLAIHISTTLSRRLKAKDPGSEKIFESTIISIYGANDDDLTQGYALNFATSMSAETGKRVVLLNIGKSVDKLSLRLGVKLPSRVLALDKPFFDEEAVKGSICRHPFGIDSINILHSPGKTTHIIPVLSYLTKDYHYVVVDLPDHMDKVIFESLKQSDMIHIVTSPSEKGMRSTGMLIGELNRSSINAAKKIRIIACEDHGGKPMESGNMVSVLKHDIFATLPDPGAVQRKAGSRRVPIVISSPDSAYSRVVRRVSRQAGDCLLGISFGCGGAMGLAHIGIIKVLERENIPIDMISGTSIGGIIGALWASGRSAGDMEDIFLKLKGNMDIVRLVDIVFPKMGLIKGKEVRKFLHQYFGSMTFRDLKRPLKIVTCDIETREEVILDKGSVLDAVMAAVSIPGIFEPVIIGGRSLMDGGIINPLPTSVLAGYGVSKIIGVNALPSSEDIQISKRKIGSIFDIIVNSIQASEYIMAEISCHNADIAMHPILPKVGWFEFYEAKKIYKRGEEEAMKYLPQIKELASVR